MSHEFPKCMYHDTEPACLVYNAAEQKALGPEWRTTPDRPAAPPPPVVAAPIESKPKRKR